MLQQSLEIHVMSVMASWPRVMYGLWTTCQFIIIHARLCNTGHAKSAWRPFNTNHRQCHVDV